MKLLQRTRRPIWIYATLVLSLSIPAYYLILRNVWLADIDEDLEVVKQKVERGINTQRLEGEALRTMIAHLNALDGGIHLSRLPADSSVVDRFRTLVRYDDLHGHMEPFRTYESTVTLNGVPYLITVYRVVEETEELVTSIALVALISLLLLFGGMVVLDRVSAKRVWAPFHHLLDRLKRFHVDDTTPFQATPTGITEFDELEGVLEQLTLRSMTLYAEQRRFTENAAHELRTPIALLQAKLERLFQCKDLTQEQAALLEEADDLLRRMRRTHDGLLTLANVDNAPVHSEASCDPGAIVHALLQNAEEQITSLGLAVEVHTEPNMQWTMESAMAEILIGNLVSNAIRHNKEGGAMRIDLSSGVLSVANSGATTSLDPAGLFKRFSASGKGLGLGLAIAHRVCERQGWSLHYAFEHGMHIFTVRSLTNS